jgi:hypothetical protein
MQHRIVTGLSPTNADQLSHVALGSCVTSIVGPNGGAVRMATAALRGEDNEVYRVYRKLDSAIPVMKAAENGL